MGLDVCADETIKLSSNNIDENRRAMKYGLCPFSDSCYLYLKHDYHCSQSRGVFLINGSAMPSCYEKRE